LFRWSDIDGQFAFLATHPMLRLSFSVHKTNKCSFVTWQWVSSCIHVYTQDFYSASYRKHSVCNNLLLNNVSASSTESKAH